MTTGEHALNWAKRIGGGLLAGLLLILIALMTWEPFFAPAPAAPSTRAYSAQITRDEFGVPHIHGKTDPDVAFGIAMAHAEDDFATLQDVAAMTRGRYGAIAGADGAKVDFAFHLLDARGTVQRRYAALPGDVKALLDAYAAGLNRYAAEHPGEVKLARLFPLNGRDIAGRRGDDPRALWRDCRCRWRQGRFRVPPARRARHRAAPLRRADRKSVV